ncbi:Cysteinyl-tRNA Synthetase [Yasminevirus sp. GU-2018]|uniref:cysteine--tRNA ligase n=1 Tax=Yasminevirus sp. GU-2018 TaxID=2420051 RepID=A0A5K0U9K3_9VIRU|nr:Cysteinyl-tRNA Synthetase [Yasminevirus sp. GU-2018]
MSINKKEQSLHGITLLDTMSGKTFEVSRNHPLRIYICGPTVYTNTHVGHLKTYMTFDIVRRVLEDHFGVPVRYMMNITNVDDKIIKGTYQKEYGLNDSVDLRSLPTEKYLPNEKFVEFSDNWERDFFRVMDKMGIRRPNIVSRVTEYIDEIIEFVDQIDKNGFAFEDNGSVYFYGTKYNNIKDDEKSAGDDENAYSKDPENPHNFVLLKKTRPYEPGWPSRWGSVRPGWHIECSAMASSVFGENFDIHGGGVDLKFPHHHNELQQSNSRFNNTPSTESHGWVDHFMHTGHLNIEGLKMSRSLKNFITVEEIAKSNTPNQLRMLFLIHRWNEPMDYSDDTIKHAVFFADMFTNFFVQANSILLRQNVKENKKFSQREIDASGVLMRTVMQVDERLRDNIDTPAVIKLLQELISNLFKYVSETETEGDLISKEIVTDVVGYVKRILSMFGVSIGSEKGSDSNEGKLLKVISDIRGELRTTAKNIGTKLKSVDKTLSTEVPKELYALTDRIRDKMLPEIGVQLTDK